MACSDLYNTITQFLAAPPAPNTTNAAYFTLTTQISSSPDALVQSVVGTFTKDSSGNLSSGDLPGISEQGAFDKSQVTNLNRYWLASLSPAGVLIVHEGTGRLIVLNQVFTCTDGNCGLLPNTFVGSFTLEGGLRFPFGNPTPPPKGIVVMSVALVSQPIIQ